MTDLTRCTHGFCTKEFAEYVVSPTAIGHRVDRLCADHAARQRELNADMEARWAALDVRTRKGRRAVA